MSRFNLRKRARVCYHEPEEPPFDEFIFCTECRDYVYEYCSIHGPLLVILDEKVGAITGFPAFVPRAALTIPRVFLHIAYSRIPEAGLGVFSTLTLPAGVRFGPYRGQRVQSIGDSNYGWQICDRDHKPSYIVDARDPDKSNWMRYVNCSRHHLEQNLVAYQYQGQLYYRTVKVVPRFTELLVFYGSEFANRLGVDLRGYRKPCPCPICQASLAATNSRKESSKTNKRKASWKDNNERRDEKIETSSTKNIKPLISHDLPSNGVTQGKKKKSEEIPKEISAGSTQDLPSSTAIQEKKENTSKKNPLNKFQVISDSQNDLPFNTDMQEASEKSAVTKTIFSKRETNYQCDKCDKHYKDKLDLEKHINSHEQANVRRDIRTFSCKICNCMFNTKMLLLQHENSRHGSKYYACKDCDFATKWALSLQIHVRTHTGERPYKCTQCNSTFAQRGDLQRHQRIHTGEKPYKCTQCTSAFAQRSNLQIHQRIHTGEKPYKCSQCNSTFAQRGDLQRHQRIHTGEKPYKCSQCNSTFAQRGDLQRHQRIHTGEKPYKCTQCTSAFAQRSNLQIHQRIHTGEKPYKCTQCTSAFTQRGSLQIHQRIHTGEKPYKCSQCNSTFVRRGSLQIHQRIHTGEKPFECNICDYKTIRSSNLKTHLMSRHSGQKPFSCDACNYKSATRANLRSHMKSRHKLA